MRRILTYGKLRKDIILFGDFSTLLTTNEVKSTRLSTRIGGSVYNTSRLIAEQFSDAEIFLALSDKSSLVDELFLQTSKISNFHIEYTSKPCNDYPLTIIMVDSTGEKIMISHDTDITNDISKILETKLNSFELWYSSFYEVDDNFLYLAEHSFSNFISLGGYVMVDLCPLIKDVDVQVANKVLSNLNILSGNIQEYSILLDKLKFTSINDFLNHYSNIQSAWIKQGSEGASVYIKDNDGRYISIVEKIKDVVPASNTTGCGDVFNAIVAYGILNTQDYQKILIHAVQVSKKIASDGIPWTIE